MEIRYFIGSPIRCYHTNSTTISSVVLYRYIVYIHILHKNALEISTSGSSCTYRHYIRFSQKMVHIHILQQSTSHEKVFKVRRILYIYQQCCRFLMGSGSLYYELYSKVHCGIRTTKPNMLRPLYKIYIGI